MGVCARLVVGSTLALTIAAHTQTPPAAGSGLIVGQVIDAATGKPLSGAVVTTASAPAGVRILTGSDGWFVFRDLPRGSFIVTATKLGYVEGAYGRRRPGGPTLPVRLAEGEAVGDIVVRMWKFGAIAGTVVDEAGEPLVGVRISAFRRTIVGGNRRFGARTVVTTDDRGVYRFGNLVPGDYVVGMLARPTGVPTASATEFRQGPASTTIMYAGDTAYVLGRGAPIPPPLSGNRMLVYPPTFYPSTSGPPAIVTVASGEERTGIDLQLHPVPSVRVSGRVMDLPEGLPGGILLVLMPAPIGELPFDTESSIVPTDRDGTFVIPALTSGQYSIRVLPEGPRLRTTLWADVPVAVGAADVDGLSIVPQPGLRISGRAEFEGAAAKPEAQVLQQVQVLIDPADVTSVAAPPAPLRLDANGAFTTLGLPPAKYFVRIRDSPVGWMFKSATYNGRNVADLPLDLQGGDATNVVITFTDRWTGFRGTVQPAEGMRSDEAAVLLFPTDPQAWSSYGPNPRRLKSALTTRTGEYSFASVPAGDYYVVALPDEQAADWQDPQFLELLTRIATQISVSDGEQKVQNLRMQRVR